MKFSEAMEKLQSGSKVTREAWKNDGYFMMNENNINFHRKRLTSYVFNESIMISDGWMVEDIEGEFRFCDVIEYLGRGLKVKLKEWKEQFISVDENTRDIILHQIEPYFFTPTYQDFLAQDWMEVL